jgi:hypothetical protein
VTRLGKKAGTHRSHPVPEAEFLIAVNRLKKQTLLFKLTRNKVRWIPTSRHECIGSALWQLHPMLRDFEFILPEETALFCGIRMMNQAKRIIQSVGGKTEAMALMNDGATHIFDTANTALIESLVANFDEYLGKFVFTSVSNVSKEFADIDKNCEKNFSEVPATLKQYRERYKELNENPVV